MKARPPPRLAVGTGKGEQLVARRCRVHAVGIITELAQPSLGQQHHVDIMITDEAADFRTFRRPADRLGVEKTGDGDEAELNPRGE